MEINEQTVSSGDSVPEENLEGNVEVNVEEVLNSAEEEALEDGVLNTDEAGEVNNEEAADTFSYDELIQLQEQQGIILEQLSETVEAGQQTIWEKPIDEYTPMEGYLCLIMFMILGLIIFKIVGGLLCIK